MYKIFHGFHLVEAYQDLKKAKRLAKNQTVARCIKLTVAITLSLILWLLPIDTFGIEGLTGLSLKPWGIALKFLFLHHENILFPND